jgi:hypothetical protein
VDINLHISTLYGGSTPGISTPSPETLLTLGNSPGEYLRLMSLLAVERHKVMVRRHLLVTDPPWTGDPLLADRKRGRTLNTWQGFDRASCEIRQAAWDNEWTPLELLVQSCVYRAVNLRGWFEPTAGGLPSAVVPVDDYRPAEYLALLEARAAEIGAIRNTAYKAWMPPSGSFLLHLAGTCIPRLLSRAQEAVEYLRTADDPEAILLGLTRLLSMSKSTPKEPGFHALQVFRDLAAPEGPAMPCREPWFRVPAVTEDSTTVLGPGALPSLRDGMGIKIRDRRHALDTLRRLQSGLSKALDSVGGEEWREIWPRWMPAWPGLSLCDVESLCCEARKVSSRLGADMRLGQARAA